MLHDIQVDYWAKLYNFAREKKLDLFTLGAICAEVTGADIQDGKRIVARAAERLKEAENINKAARAAEKDYTK